MASQSETGKSVVYYAPGDVRIEDMKPIDSTGDGEVTIRVEACAICGTDIKSYLKGNPRIKPPMIMGHEFCGEIIEVGENVEGYKAGQRVTMATTIGCGDCIYCNQEGQTSVEMLRQWAFIIRSHGALHKDTAKAVRQGHLVDVGIWTVVVPWANPVMCYKRPEPGSHGKIKSALVLGLGPWACCMQ